MNFDPTLWLIFIPILSSPVIYLAGRLASGRQLAAVPSLPHGGPQSSRQNLLPRWLGLAALLAAWAPFFLSARQFSVSGPAVITFASLPLTVDGLSLLLAAVVLALGTLAVLFSGPYMAGEVGEEKFYAMLVALVGVIIALGHAGDLFNLWIWFEAMAISSVLLVVFYREQQGSLEAGVKYVMQSAVGSVLVLIGIALVLAETGSVDLAAIHNSARPSLALLAAGGLFVVGFGVKVAIVPFHTWLPDAHTQAPSGISAMLSGIVIEAGLIALLRSLGALSGVSNSWGLLFMVFGALNMLVGNLMALRQTQVKRLLAYSSLSHIGYMVFGLGIAIAAGQAAGAQGGLFHLLNHGLMKGLAFLAAGALLYTLHTAQGDHSPLTTSDLAGTAQRYPLTALALSLAVLGLGGLPPLAGFMSKWQIFVAGFSTHNFVVAALVIFAALNSVLSLAYYAPMVNMVYRKTPSAAVRQGAAMPVTMNVTMALLVLAVVAIGLWPNLVAWLTEPAGSALLAMFAH
jgi:proton-translocating NADH-quinone oxidoreductase chain N